MVRSFSCLLRLVALLLAAASPLSAATEGGTGGTVLLTFDVEESGDAEALELLDLTVRATYFITGDYGRSYPDLVRRLAREGNTIGSHSFFHHDLTTLAPDQRELDLQMSRVVLQGLGCVPVQWFRPPYLAYDDATMGQAIDAGFVFSSADKDLWPRNPTLPELPISTHDGGLVSDWDMFLAQEWDNPTALQFLVEAYEAHRTAGRPFVVLLHPRIIGARPDVLRSFMTHVETTGGSFLTVDDFLREEFQLLPSRIGLWLDRNPTGVEAQHVAAEVERLGVTDLVVPLANAEPAPPSLPFQGSRLDPVLVDLRSRGVRVLGAISLLRAPDLLARRPDLAMMDTAGKRSRLWASPSHPAFQSQAVATVRALSRNPALDGLLLTDLRYPTVHLDHSPSAFASFAATSGHTVDAIDDIWRLYVDWSRWRAGELASLIEAVSRAAKQAHGTDFIVGGAFPSEAVLDHRVVEQTSQDLLRLAPLLDLTVMTLSAEGLARDPALLVRTRLGAEAQDGGTDTMLAVTPPLAVGADRDDLHPARSTVLFGDDIGPSRPAPPFRALRLLPDSAMTRTQPPWMSVPDNCADVAPLPLE